MCDNVHKWFSCIHLQWTSYWKFIYTYWLQKSEYSSKCLLITCGITTALSTAYICINRLTQWSPMSGQCTWFEISVILVWTPAYSDMFQYLHINLQTLTLISLLWNTARHLSCLGHVFVAVECPTANCQSIVSETTLTPAFTVWKQGNIPVYSTSNYFPDVNYLLIQYFHGYVQYNCRDSINLEEHCIWNYSNCVIK